MTTAVVSSARVTASRMRYPWQRLQVDRTTGETVVRVFVAVVLAGLAAITADSSDTLGILPAIIVGALASASAILLVVANPARYRVHGLSMRHWKLDHGILVAVIAATCLGISVAWTDSYGQSLSTSALPLLSMLVTLAVLARHYRGILAGRLIGTGSQFAGTPWFQRLFLAKSGPRAWRIIYQPVGLMVSVVMVFAAAFFVDDPSEGVISLPVLAAPLAAPVVAVSREVALAVGMPRKTWLAHVIVAVAGPTFAVMTILVLIWATSGLPGELVEWAAFADPRPVDSTALLILRLLLLATAVAALSVLMSLEDWGTTLLWFFLSSWGVIWINFGPLQVMDGVGASVGILALHVACAAWLVKLARKRVVHGRPEWTITSIIDGARRIRN